MLAADFPATDPGDIKLPERFGSSEAATEWLVSVADERFGSLFGQPAARHWFPYEVDGWPMMATFDGAPVNGGPFNGAPLIETAELSRATDQMVAHVAASAIDVGARLQVPGIGEADLIATDGSFLYPGQGR